MALLFVDSFDHYNKAHLLGKWTSATFDYTIGVGQGRCGTTALRLGASADVIIGLPFGSLTGTVGFAFKADSAGSQNQILIAYLGASTARHLALWRNPDGSLLIVNASNVALGVTAPGLVHADTFHFIEWQSLIDVAAGTVVLRVDNVPVLSLSGIRTQGASTPLELRTFHFVTTSNVGFVVDDFYALDSTGPSPANTFLGDCRVEYLRPRADGSLQDWTLVGAASHWQAVDDAATPDDDLSYLQALAPGLSDTQLYRQTGLPSGSIFGLQVSLLARKTDSGERLVAPVIRAGGTSYLGANQAPSASSYRYLRELFPTNPATGAAWTTSGVNNSEYGAQVTE